MKIWNKKIRVLILIGIIFPFISTFYRTEVIYDHSPIKKDTYAISNEILMAYITAWTPNGTAICTEDYNQGYLQIVRDNSGGAIIIWNDFRSGSDFDIYAQRINAAGIVQWKANGTIICNANNNQWYPQLIGDGIGGAISTWYDYRKNNNDNYAQKINATGDAEWIPNGTVICNASDEQYSPQLVYDGAAGAIITWEDHRNTFNDKNIYAQRINAVGETQWTPNGTVICNATGNQEAPRLINDEKGGIILTWIDYRNGESDIYTQKSNFSGESQWTKNGTIICNASNYQINPKIISDGSGGAIIIWQDARNDVNYDIYAQRINSTGDVQWNPNGTLICNATNGQKNLNLIQDSTGGAIITWEDERNGTSDSNIYIQRINFTGQVQWYKNGTAICTLNKEQMYPQLVSDCAGGAIITWYDYRNGTYSDIYMQRINAAGEVLWDNNGTALCTAYHLQTSPQLMSDGAEGAFIVWQDRRNGGVYDDIYAQYVKAESPNVPVNDDDDKEKKPLTPITISGIQIEPLIVISCSIAAILYVLMKRRFKTNLKE